MQTSSRRPDVTVVITTRNRRRMLSEAIASVQRQAGISWELHIIDDDSTDDTPVFLGTLTQPEIRWSRMERQAGRSAARNFGLAQARAPYIMFLDDDDLLLPRALASLANALSRYPEAVASVGARRDWFVQERYERRASHPRIARCRRVFDELLFRWSAVSGQNLFRTNLVERVGGFDPLTEICEDRDLWLRLARLGPVVLRPEAVMTYRIHSGQWRPPDIRRLREWVALRAIRTLPRLERRHGLLLRRSSHLMDRAEDLMRDGHVWASAAQAIRALMTSPRLFASPLIRGWVIQRLAGGLWRHFSPVRKGGSE